MPKFREPHKDIIEILTVDGACGKIEELERREAAWKRGDETGNLARWDAKTEGNETLQVG
jgi:hypothetical protein